MIGQLTNIAETSLQYLKPADAGSSVKTLPPANSIVSITVLEKQQGTTKLLVEGSVFLSKLPLQASPGETMLAKVLSQEPFTLGLNNLISMKNLTDKNLAILLGKLQVENNSSSAKVLKAFISTDRPVSKAKLKRIIELIEKENLQLDDRQMAFLIQAATSSEEAYQSLDESTVHLFKHSDTSLSQKVLSSLEEMDSRGLKNEEKDRIEGLLTCSITDDKMPDGKDLKDNDGKIARCIEYLEEIKGSSPSNSALSLIAGLQKTLTEYLILKSYYRLVDEYPGFMILKGQEDGYDLFNYRFDRLKGSFRIEINMEPSQMGRVSLQGYVNDTSLNCSFTSGDEAARVLSEGKEEIISRLKDSLGIVSRLSFNSGPLHEPMTVEMRSVNARV